MMEDQSEVGRFVPAPAVMPPSFAPAGRSAGTPAGSADAPAAQQNVAPRASRSAKKRGGAKEEEQGGSFFWSLFEFIVLLIVALACSALIKTFLIQAYAIPSGSMENTLVPGDHVFVNKLVDEPSEINRGDVVVFTDPGNWLEGVQQPERGPLQSFFMRVGEGVGIVPRNVGTHLIKRVIGVEGDVVACCTTEGLVTVNGEPIHESYLQSDIAPSTAPFEVTVPEGHLWVMGDNRSNSKDSRWHQEETGFGFVPVSHVEGRAWLLFYPFDRWHTISSYPEVFAGVPASPATPEG